MSHPLWDSRDPRMVPLPRERPIEGIFCEEECRLHDTPTPLHTTLYRAYMYLIEKSLRIDTPADFVIRPVASYRTQSVQPPVVHERTGLDALFGAIAAEIYAPGPIKMPKFSQASLIMGYAHVSVGDRVGREEGLWHRFWEIHFTQLVVTRNERPLGIRLLPTAMKV